MVRVRIFVPTLPSYEQLDSAPECCLVRPYFETVSDNVFMCASSCAIDCIHSNSLPEIQEELQKLIRRTEENLHELPKPLSEDAFSEVMHILGGFCRDVARHVEGVPDEDGLLQAIRPAQAKFRGEILRTAPAFRSYTRNHTGDRSVSPPEFLATEDRGDYYWRLLCGCVSNKI
jgi:hypothetical protein